jgi:DNA-binding GntR family transcriptional regulator
VCPRRRDARPRQTAPEQLAGTLRERILDGTLAAGTPLREEELAREHEHSRHTVRAALAQLTAERLVQFEPYRGARVASLTISEVEDLQTLRGALESEAVRLLHERHGTRWPREVLTPIEASIAALEAAELDGGWLEITRAHAAVHAALVAAPGSARICEAHAGLTSETLLLLLGVRAHYPRGSLAAEHRDYLQMVQSGDIALVREHLAHTTELIRTVSPRVTSDRAPS